MPEARQQVLVQRMRVGSKRRRLIELARTCSDNAHARSAKPLLRGLSDREARRSPKRSAPESDLGLLAPRLRLSASREGTANRFSVPARPGLGLVGGRTGARSASAHLAGASMSNGDAFWTRKLSSPTRRLGLRTGRAVYRVVHAAMTSSPGRRRSTRVGWPFPAPPWAKGRSPKTVVRKSLRVTLCFRIRQRRKGGRRLLFQSEISEGERRFDFLGPREGKHCSRAKMMSPATDSGPFLHPASNPHLTRVLENRLTVAALSRRTPR